MKLIFACVTGSHLYGTNRPDSDVDIRGVCLNPIDGLLGLEPFKQWMPDKKEAVKWSTETLGIESDDITIYGLNRFVELLLQNNPNIVELFFAENLVKELCSFNQYVHDTVWSRKGDILSTNIISTFSGYAYSQLQRLKGHKKWIDNPPTEPDPKDFGMVITPKGGQKWTNPDKYNQYKKESANYQQYRIWLKERNPARQELERKHGYDTKHAMHIFRLLLEAKQLLLTGEIKFPFVDDDMELLHSVLHGKYEYQYIVNFGEEGKKSLVELEQISVLPKYPNFNAINKMLIDINKTMINET